MMAAGVQAQPEKTAPRCTRETPRCDFWNWGHDYVRPPCCTSHLKQLLWFTEDLLSSNGILHWLDYGSLLGAVRSHEFIPWDSDVDWGIRSCDLPQLRSLASEVADAGHLMDASDPYVVRIQLSATNTQHVDIFPWHEEKGLLQVERPGSSPAEGSFPSRFLKNLQPVSLYGRTFPAPAPVEEFLAAYRYGPDFRSPLRPAEAGHYHRTSSLGTIESQLRSFALRRKNAAQFGRNLASLNDVLAATPLAGRYWVMGGLLIGWAREGRILRHDSEDADFGLLQEDQVCLLDAVSTLLAAGFRPLYRYIDNRGVAVQYTFAKNGGRFDFFLHEPNGSAIECRFFGTLQRDGRPVPTEFRSSVPRFTLAPMAFLDRTWLKPADHDSYLTSIYGAWRVSNPAYDYKTDDRSIVEVVPWTGTCKWRFEE